MIRETSAATPSIQNASDLLTYLDGKDSLAYRYVELLRKAAVKGYPVGMREETQKEEALSDWEAAACLPESRREDITMDSITETREKLNRASEIVTRHGHRMGKPTFKLNPKLTD